LENRSVERRGYNKFIWGRRESESAGNRIETRRVKENARQSNSKYRIDVLRKEGGPSEK